jgi:hypothetical protein
VDETSGADIFSGAKQFRAAKREKIVFDPQLADLPVQDIDLRLAGRTLGSSRRPKKLRGRQSQ